MLSEKEFISEMAKIINRRAATNKDTVIENIKNFIIKEVQKRKEIDEETLDKITLSASLLYTEAIVNSMPDKFTEEDLQQETNKTGDTHVPGSMVVGIDIDSANVIHFVCARVNSSVVIRCYMNEDPCTAVLDVNL